MGMSASTGSVFDTRPPSEWRIEGVAPVKEIPADRKRQLIRACLRELDEGREHLARAATIARGNARTRPDVADTLEALLPDTDTDEDGGE